MSLKPFTMDGKTVIKLNILCFVDKTWLFNLLCCYIKDWEEGELDLPMTKSKLQSMAEDQIRDFGYYSVYEWDDQTDEGVEDEVRTIATTHLKTLLPELY